MSVTTYSWLLGTASKGTPLALVLAVRSGPVVIGGGGRYHVSTTAREQRVRRSMGCADSLTSS